MKLIKTTDPGLFRDYDTRSIICTDLTSYSNYKLARKNFHNVSKLEKQMTDLKELLLKGNK